MKIKRIITTTFFFLIIISCFSIYQRYEFKPDTICTNLEKRGNVTIPLNCSISGNAYDIISEIFPIGIVSYEYVMDGMDGFQIIDEYTLISSGVLDYCDPGDEIKVIEIEVIPGFWRGQETFDFWFCKNTLADLRWNN